MPKKLENLERLADDIREIRRSLYKNRNIIQSWLASGSIRFVYVYSGLLVMVFCALQYYFISVWHAYSLVPQTVRFLLIIGFIFAMAVPGILKIVSLISYREHYPDTKSIGIILKLYGTSHLVNYFIMEVLAIALCLYFGFNGIPQYCVPAILLGLGVIMTSLWGQFALSETLVFGLWLIVSGLASLPFIARSPVDAWIWLGLGLGLGGLVIPVYAWAKTKSKKE